MGRVIGYCRVSTEDQNLEMQEQAIEKYAKEKQKRKKFSKNGGRGSFF